jgi:hypothetical protein
VRNEYEVSRAVLGPGSGMMKNQTEIPMRCVFFLAIVLFAGCGCFPMATYPKPKPPLVEEPAKEMDLNI